ncbi:winged helix-turn-helix domain-containing protein [Streptomyces sp. HNM0663]|uniref:Winged helix-turn-helix domain-containing protein n=1 Tax=Streptomyces chengmaiensis TaxID=3040919 RepID=A0ABT6HRI2_9ACTN|nr:winged helix-turn-helix domain-containing protein [Streptomyces chengmaiensis]MDH2391319.1 winged helix-turn-helix domain-containing protein [Streptomyces chengmaiensis]
MLRIHFTGDDLAGVRMAARPDVLWETILSFHRLRDRRGATVFGEWRSETRARLNGETRLLSALVPPKGYFPDFLTPPEARDGLDAGLQALRATPPARLRAELALAAADRACVPGLPGRLAALAEGRAEPLARLVGALHGYFRAAVEPYWPHLQARIEADRAVRGRALLDGGPDELLDSLSPVLRWRAPVLEADYPVDRELRLGGRGLLLQPSFFCRGTPVVYRDPTLPPVLVYPVADRCGPAFHEPGGPSLGRLVGHTRSAVLQAIRSGSTTSELARRAGVSLASASQHAAVLREAGLVVTLRHGNSVLHTLTPLGAALLRGGVTPEALGEPPGSVPPDEPGPGRPEAAGPRLAPPVARLPARTPV